MARKKPIIPKKPFNKSVPEDAIEKFDTFYRIFGKIIYFTEGDAMGDVIKAGVATLTPLLEKKVKELRNGN